MQVPRLLGALAPLALVAIAVTSFPSTAHASHFRFGHLTWKPLGGTTVEFTFTAAFRRDMFAGPGPFTGPGGLPGIGDLIVEGTGNTSLSFGDGTGTGTLRFRITAIDPAANWMLGRAVNPADFDQDAIPKTYNGAGPFIAFAETCCKISDLQNQPDAFYRLETIVDFSGNTSPVSSLTPIVLVPDDTIHTFQLPAGDVDPDSVLRFRLATNLEKGNAGPHPPTLSVDPITGMVTFDTRDSVLNTDPGHMWTTQIVIEDRHAVTDVLRTKVPIDFILLITQFVGDPPECEITPAGPYTAFVGVPFSLNIRGSTTIPDQTVTINHGGLPVGATTTPPLPASSTPVPGMGSFLDVSFDWTPAPGQAGPHPIFFTITDSLFQQTQCSITINVIDQVQVPVDIKPGSCPNPLNVKSRGVLPVAVLSTATFDATMIDPSTVVLTFGGIEVSPVRARIGDVGTPFEPFVGKTDCVADCHELGPDGLTDMLFFFDVVELVSAFGLEALADRSCVVFEVEGQLLDGSLFIGEDVVRILNR